jgi:hypothetical protein
MKKGLRRGNFFQLCQLFEKTIALMKEELMHLEDLAG